MTCRQAWHRTALRFWAPREAGGTRWGELRGGASRWHSACVALSAWRAPRSPLPPVPRCQRLLQRRAGLPRGQEACRPPGRGAAHALQRPEVSLSAAGLSRRKDRGEDGARAGAEGLGLRSWTRGSRQERPTAQRPRVSRGWNCHHFCAAIRRPELRLHVGPSCHLHGRPER